MIYIYIPLITIKVCKHGQDHKQCLKEILSLRIDYKPSLFQHIGKHSSLKGTERNIFDR